VASKARKTAAGGVPSSRIRLKICSGINDQFEGMNPPAQLASPPVISDCSVWTCDAASGLGGVTCLKRRIVFYAAVTGPNQMSWWRIGAVPVSVMP
jgi:hypothetical protein